MIVESKAGNRLVGFYRGQVLKHLPHGRCKIYIPGVFSEEYINTPDMLPDAELAAPLFAGSNTGNGVFSYPNISAIVWCFFANDDQNYPVYFASTLGGENAFGQHEIVMPPRHRVKENGQDEDLSNVLSLDIQSNRHLITSGHSQIEIYESGKISAYVSDPQRRDATVDYNNQYQLLRQDDHVSARPVCELCAVDAIRHIECRHVLDNEYHDGRIVATTDLFEPIQLPGNVILSSYTNSTIDQDNWGKSSRILLKHEFNRVNYSHDVENRSVNDLHNIEKCLTETRYLSTNSIELHFNYDVSLTAGFDEIYLYTGYYNHNKDLSTNKISVNNDAESEVTLNSTRNTGAEVDLINKVTKTQYHKCYSTRDGIIKSFFTNLATASRTDYKADEDGNIQVKTSDVPNLICAEVNVNTSNSRVSTTLTDNSTSISSYVQLDNKAGVITIHINNEKNSTITIEKDGNITLNADTKLLINIGNSAKAVYGCDGSINLEAPADLTINGNTHIIGTLDVTSDILSKNGDIKSSTYTLNGHQHYYNPGPGALTATTRTEG